MWCLGIADSADVEHIIPESLGGTWTLPGTVVCKACNNSLSHLDRAFSDPFDFLTFHYGVRGKKGKHKRVSSRGNLIAERTAEGPIIRVNSENRSVTMPDGRVLSRYGRSPRNVRAKFSKLEGGLAQGNLNVPFAFDRTATRGAVKIGFETLAHHLEDDYVLHERFNAVRDYVRLNKGDRRALFTAPKDQPPGLALWPPTFVSVERVVSAFRIYTIDFHVDLTPDCGLMPELEAEAKALHAGAWHIIPDEI